jgi:hypothetical protein
MLDQLAPRNTIEGRADGPFLASSLDLYARKTIRCLSEGLKNLSLSFVKSWLLLALIHTDDHRETDRRRQAPRNTKTLGRSSLGDGLSPLKERGAESFVSVLRSSGSMNDLATLYPLSDEKSRAAHVSSKTAFGFRAAQMLLA